MKLDEVSSNIEKRVKEEYEQKYRDAYNEEKIINLLDEIRNNNEKKFLDLGLPKETIDMIFSTDLTKANYLKNREMVYISEKSDIILRIEYSSYVAISDILDSVFNGLIHTRNFDNEISFNYGHGISYYSKNNLDYSKKFNEIMANYSVILNSPNRYEALSLLKDILGEEFCAMIENFYYENLVKDSSFCSIKGKVK